MNIKQHFEHIGKETERYYGVSREARKKGLDPVADVEVPIAISLAEKTVGLISVLYPQLNDKKIVNRILELEKEYGQLDIGVSLRIAEDVAREKYCKFETHLQAIDAGIRVGFSYFTLGVVSSPLEGYTELKLEKTKEGKEYFKVYFSGPIRSAGTTASCVALMVMDYLREIFGYAKYDPTEDEIKRYVTENYDYHERINNLQYLPTEEEIIFLAKNIPIQIAGEPTTQREVSNYKDLPRIETNLIRGGMCLIFSEGLAQKSPKAWRLLKRAKKTGIKSSGWDFLEEYIEVHEKRAKKSGDNSPVYIKDIVAGRPIFGHPGKSGGFRFRYGRSRACGFSAMSVNPATMGISNDFISTGTQLKIEKPTKGAAISSCDNIDGPIVKLKDGSVKAIKNLEESREIYKDVDEIIYFGDLLVPAGDVINRNSPLLKQGYVEEWWALELAKQQTRNPQNIQTQNPTTQNFQNPTTQNFQKPTAQNLQTSATQNHQTQNPITQNLQTPLTQTQNSTIQNLQPLTPKKETPKNPPTQKINPFNVNFKEALNLSNQFKIPLHPAYIFYWTQISYDDFLSLIDWIAHGEITTDDKKELFLVLPHNKTEKERFQKGKRALELIGCEQKATLENIILSPLETKKLLFNLGIPLKTLSPKNFESLFNEIIKKLPKQGEVLEIINTLCPAKIKDKAGDFIGARMGRPEKAKLRKLTGSPHTLFPVGEQGGRLRSFQAAIEAGKVVSNFPTFFCDTCDNFSVHPLCSQCGKPCKRKKYCFKCKEFVDGKCEEHQIGSESHRRSVDIKHYFDQAKKLIGARIEELPAAVKGVRGMTSQGGECEHLAKGLLRAKYNLHVNKDGTIRYDMTEMPLTHFKPFEIGTSIEKLKELGYEKDIHGKPLKQDNQILEIFPHDIVLPSCTESDDERADDVFWQVSKFVDDELEKIYGLKKFFNIQTKEDLRGLLFACIAPHICTAVVGRCIGFSKTQVFFASPYMHAAMRRDCDGDEAAVMLLQDMLLNFSRKFLPAHRGGTQDAPLVLNSKINAGEVDDQILDFECGPYPLELYELAEQRKHSSEVKIEMIKDRLKNEEDPFTNIGFTHDVEDINHAVLNSSYKILPTMGEKVEMQMDLCQKLRSVDTTDVARLIIERHFIRDIKGNFRKFSMQVFRCVKCNSKYRRPPLTGKCTKCGGKLIFTISEGSIMKYVEKALTLGKTFGVSPYLLECLDLVEKDIQSVFGKEKEKQEALGKWF